MKASPKASRWQRFAVAFAAAAVALLALDAAWLAACPALMRGALFGFVCHAACDLTHQATVAGWPWHVTLIDPAWGTFLPATSAWASRRALHFASR